MKNKKKQIGLVIGPVCALLCAVLLLTGCVAGPKEENQEPSSVESTEDMTEDTSGEATQATEHTEETTQPEEEPTEEEPTEETTEEPTEEETTGGNSSAGGTGGFTGGTVLGDEEDEESSGSSEEVVDVAAPGTETNAYTEFLYALPDTPMSVAIPTDSTIYYHFYNADDTLLTIEDGDAYVIYNGATYTADEEGIVSVHVLAEENMPVQLQLGNSSGAEEMYALKFIVPYGREENPEKISSLEEISLTLAAGDTYYYSYEPLEDGTVSLTLESIDPEDALCEIEMINGENSALLSESEDGTVTLEISADYPLIIRVTTGLAEDGSPDGEAESEGTEAPDTGTDTEEPDTPDAEDDPVEDEATDIPVTVVISGEYIPGPGTSANPYTVLMDQIPGSFETVEIAPGKAAYYNVYYVSGNVLTIESETAYVVYNGSVYTPDGNGVIQVLVTSDDPRYPVYLAIGNTGSTAAGYSVSVAPPLGSMDNPLVAEEAGELTVAVPEGTGSGYYLQWTAPDHGVLSLTATAAPETTEFDVIVTNTNGYAMAWLSDGSPLTMEVSKDDVLMIQIAITPDENWVYPAADITLSMVFDADPGTETNPYTAYVEELPGEVVTQTIGAGDLVWYNVFYVSGSNLTVADETVYIIYNDTAYYPDANGEITIPVKSSGNNTFVAFQIGNVGQEDTSYTLRFVPNKGTMANPEVIHVLTTLDTAIPSANASYCYSYTATADGAVSFWIDEEASTENITYDIILTRSHYDSETDSYSYSYAYLSEGEYGTVSMILAEEDVVTIEVTASMTATVAVRGTVYTGEGTSERPYMTTVTLIPGGFATVDVVNGGLNYYSIYRVGGTIMTIEGEDAYVVYDGTTYKAVNGVVTVELAAPRAGHPVSFAVGNYLTTNEKKLGENDLAEGYVMHFVYPLGTYSNPEVLTDITSFSVDLEKNNEVGYYFRWTAPVAGTVTFEILSTTNDAVGGLVITQDNSATQTVLEGEGTVSIEVDAGTVVQIVVAALPDESFVYPETTITVSGVYETDEAEPEEVSEDLAEETEEPVVDGESTNTDDPEEQEAVPEESTETGSTAEETESTETEAPVEETVDSDTVAEGTSEEDLSTEPTAPEEDPSEPVE